MEKKFIALTAVARASCKGQSTLHYIHQGFLQLTYPIKCHLKGLPTSAQILISHNLPSQALFTVLSISLFTVLFFWQCRMPEKAIKAFLLTLRWEQANRDNTLRAVTRGRRVFLHPHVRATVVSTEPRSHPAPSAPLLTSAGSFRPQNARARIRPVGAVLSSSISCVPSACCRVHVWG